ncbi:MAG TPA: hypothetical protein VMM60_12195 [Ilumatobacter sp.]|nr:hypothetical protein [Ilumatobacter sp.]
MTTPAGGMPRLAPALPTLPATPTLPTVTVPEASPLALVEPELVDAVAAVVEQEEDRFITDGPQHPMAHLMPVRTKPTEAQQRANQLRAAKKKKSRRIKVVAVIATVAFGALAGPPLATWLVDAVNESGSTTNTTDEPAPADDATTGDSDVPNPGG